MDFSSRRVPDADTIDLDELSAALGGPLWLPAGDELNLSGETWSSRLGTEHVYLVTTTPEGSLRRVESFRQAPGLGHLEQLVRDVCLDNRRDPESTHAPRFPDVEAVEVELAGEHISGFSLAWLPVSITMFRLADIRLLVGTIDDDAPGRIFLRGTGRHPVRMPPDRSR